MSLSTGRDVIYQEDEAVARIVLNRPARLNALTANTWDELREALHRARDPRVRAVIVTGAGRAFCSGSDLKANFDHALPAPAELLRSSRHPVLLAIRALPKPVVSAVNGIASGIGCSLALAADLVIACESASFDFAFSRVGLAPDGGLTWTLVNAIGRPRAMRLTMRGELLSARQALEYGLIGWCVADALFDQEVERVTSALAAGPTVSYAAIKASIDAAANASLPQQLEVEANHQAVTSDSQDFAEGLAAFEEKRRPRFMGN